MITKNEISHAAELLRGGKIVAFPTETVYGLGADASQEEAIKRVFSVKKRPFHNPLIVHLADASLVDDLAFDISPKARILMAAFWPGPLTLLLKKKEHVSSLLSASQPQIGLRVPKHPIASALLKAFGGGIAAPSANRYTRVSPTTAAAVSEELGDAIDCVLDGGPCAVGLESTILDMSQDTPVLLRPGMISVAAIEAVLAQKIQLNNVRQIKAPGGSLLHYAPETPVLLVDALHQKDLTAKTNGVLITHRPVAALFNHIDVISMPDDPMQYAHDLYHVLRTVDKKGYQQIFIDTVPCHDAWFAIADRLAKASHQEPIHDIDENFRN